MKAQFFLFFVFFTTFFCTYSFSQGPSKDSLYVESVDFKTLTFARISCGDFATNFKNRIKFKIINNVDTTVMLDSFLNKVKYARTSSDIDVRAKFVYDKRNGIKITVCTNGNDVLVDGRLIRRNNKFVDFLRSLTM